MTSEFWPIQSKYLETLVKPPGKPKVHPKMLRNDLTPTWVVIPSASWTVSGPPKSPLQKLTLSPSMQIVFSLTEFGNLIVQVSWEMTRANCNKKVEWRMSSYIKLWNLHQFGDVDLVLSRLYQLLPIQKFFLVGSRRFEPLVVCWEVSLDEHYHWK